MQICLLGAGHTHMLILQHLTRVPTPGIQWVLLNPYADFFYAGNFTSVLSGERSLASIQIPLSSTIEKIKARGNNISLRLDEAFDLNLRDRSLRFRHAGEVLFELASFNIAGESSVPHLIPLKPVAILSRLLETENFPRIQVVGGGCAGVEAALCLANRFRRQNKSVQLQLIEKSPRLLGEAPIAIQKQALELLADAGVAVIFGREPLDFEADLRLSAAPQQAPRWIRESGLKLAGKNKLIHVNSFLETSFTGVFAVGEGTCNPQDSGVHNGQVPVRQAAVLFHNLLVRAGLESQPHVFELKKPALTFLNTGHGKALGYGDTFSLGHTALNLWLKGKMDGRYMRRLQV